MTTCYPNPIRFSSVQRRKVEAAFSGGAITGNWGIPLLAEGGPAVGPDPVISSERVSGRWKSVRGVIGGGFRPESRLFVRMGRLKEHGRRARGIGRLKRYRRVGTPAK